MDIPIQAIMNYLERLEGISGDFYMEQLVDIPAPPNLLREINNKCQETEPKAEEIKTPLQNISLIQVQQENKTTV